MVNLFIQGLTVVLGLFVFCLISVIGVKWAVLTIKELSAPPPPPPTIKCKRKRKTIRSMEIDPNSVDRIFFKKNI